LSEKSGGVGQKVGEHIGWKIAPPSIQQGKNQRAWAALMRIADLPEPLNKMPKRAQRQIPLSAKLRPPQSARFKFID
jgi:hypothetical protein